MSAHLTSYQLKLDRINHYMRWQRLPRSLRGRVNDYYEYMWTCHGAQSGKDLVDELPDPLKVEIRTLIKSRLIDSQPLFLHLDPDLMLRLVDALVAFVAIPNQEIVAEGDVGTRMYFLVSGEAIVYCKMPKKEGSGIARGSSSHSARDLFKKVMDLNPLRRASSKAPEPEPEPEPEVVDAGGIRGSIRRLGASFRGAAPSRGSLRVGGDVRELHPDIAAQMEQFKAKAPRNSLPYVTPLADALGDPEVNSSSSNRKKYRRKSVLRDRAAKHEAAPRETEPVFIAKLKAGACFGEMALQQQNALRNASVMTISFCDLYYLEASAYHAIVETDSGAVFKSVMEKLAAKRLEGKQEKTKKALLGGSPKEHIHLLQTRSQSSHRLREDLVDRMESNRKVRRSGTALEVKRRASNSGLTPTSSPTTPNPRPVRRTSETGLSKKLPPL